MVDRSENYSAGLMSEAPWFHEFKKLIQLQTEGLPVDEIKRKCVEETGYYGACLRNSRRRRTSIRKAQRKIPHRGVIYGCRC